MTTQPITTPIRRDIVAVPGDLLYSTVPTGLTEPETLAYFRGFDAADRKLIRSGEGPAIVHADGKAPAPGTAAHKMMSNAASESARAYRVARHPACHAAGIRAIGTYLRKLDKLAAERARLNGTDHTPAAPARLAEILPGKPARATRKPAAKKQSFETVTEPAAPDMVAAAREAGRLTVVHVTDHPTTEPAPIVASVVGTDAAGSLTVETVDAMPEPVSVDDSLSAPAPAPVWGPGKGTRREARRELAAAMRARGESPTGEAWIAACLAAGIPTRTDAGTVTT